MTTLRFLASCLLASAAASCASPAAPGDPAITGVIVARDVSISIGGPPTMHVKESAEEECGIIFLLRSSTPVFRRTGRHGVVPRAGFGGRRRDPGVMLLVVGEEHAHASRLTYRWQ